MAENRKMTPAELADELMSQEYADVVRESVAWMVADLMEAEVAAQIGAALGEVAPAERTTQRNGYRPRRWDTRAGAVSEAPPGLLLPAPSSSRVSAPSGRSSQSSRGLRQTA